MAILVKNLHMPSECEYCGYARFYRENGRVWCNAMNRILKNKWEKPDWTYLNVKRPEWCPLIEVPEPHGRLGDLDELERMFADIDNAPYSGFDGDASFYSAEDAAQIIRLAPTVIPASKVEHE